MKIRTPDLTEQALFDRDHGGFHGALKFAFNFQHGNLKLGTLGSLVGGSRVGRGLTGLDGSGQAGLLRVELGKLLERVEKGSLHFHILIARFALPSVKCECGRLCCQGYRENPEWAIAIDDIAEYVLAAGATGTISHFRLRRALVARHFGIRVAFVDVAKQCGVNRDTASEHYRKVTDLLKKEERLARYEAEDLLKKAGLVE